MKLVNFVYITVFIVASFFIFDYATKLLSANHIYSDKMEINLYYKSDVEGESDLIEDLINFSNENNIDISQYTYTGQNNLHIYSTHFEMNSSVTLLEGQFPTKGEYLSNIRSDDEAQVGRILFPFSTDHIKVYNFEEVRNVGMSTQLYISDATEEIYQELTHFLSHHTDVEISEIRLSKLHLVNFTMMFLVPLAFVIFSIVHLSFIVNTRKRMYLLKVWGHSPFKAHLMLFKPFYQMQLIIFSISVPSLFMVLLLNQKLEYIFYYLLYLLITWFTLATLTVPISFFGLSLVYRYRDDYIRKEELIPFKNYHAASLILKILSTTALLAILSLTLIKTTEIHKANDAAVYWERTEDIYRMNLKLPNGSLANDKIINDQLLHLYNELVINEEAFLINTENFTDVSYRSDFQYLYEFNYEEGAPPVLPNGRSITIDRNYLKFNPIYTNDGIPIKEENLNGSDDTLNILIPEKYKDIEEVLKQAYLENFYMYKVKVDNIYNRATNTEINKTEIDSLSINFIYVENNQFYFTYDSDIVDHNKTHFIKDPVAIVLDGEYEASTIAAFMTTNVYFHNDSQGEAFNVIQPLLQKTNTNSYVNEVVSVYQERSEEIRWMKTELLNLIIGLVITLILMVVFLFIYTWSYFQQNAYPITLQFLFGYSYLRRHWYMILSVISANLISASLLVLILNDRNLVLYAGILIIIELLVLHFLFASLTRNQVHRTVKSE
ncbi:hypothetical protein BTS2_3673 [Bacillus sp. TS-2]|nr:hypothetical protein BTS2_3673 [Bacillus sp. TS-2]